jgi:hypothetical protein
VPDVLAVAAFQNRAPMVFVIFVKTGNFLVHRVIKFQNHLRQRAVDL